MKGLVWTEKNQMELVEMEEPQIMNAFDVKIKVYYAGICGTDLQVIKGKESSLYGIIRGHEAVGTVTETGSGVKNLQVGDRIVVDPNHYCGECFQCRSGKTNFCEGSNGGLSIAGVNKNGTFAQYFVSPEKHLYKLPKTMSWEKAVMVEPLACVLNNFKAAGVKSSDSLLVLGSGPMGLVCQMLGKKMAGLTVGSEIDSYRFKFAEKISDYVFYPDKLTVENILEINNGRKFDVIIDTVGNQMETAEKLIEKGGRIVPMAVNPGYSFEFSPTKYSVNGVKIIGAGEYNMIFDEAIRLAEILEHLGETVTAVKGIEEYKEAISEIIGIDMVSGKTIDITSLKTVIKF